MVVPFNRPAARRLPKCSVRFICRQGRRVEVRARARFGRAESETYAGEREGSGDAGWDASGAVFLFSLFVWLATQRRVRGYIHTHTTHCLGSGRAIERCRS